MLGNYSIELEVEKIYNEKTKEYFHEVISSYINGNYRSAIVLLWTISVFDLVLKLEELDTIYNDKKAEKILLEIQKMQEANPKSPEWESKLIDLISERTDMFETHEIVHFETLKNYRHISAHPTIKKGDLSLFQPTKEISRALIRNILETLLCRPPLASKEIFINFLNDLASKKDLFPKIGDLENYLKATYFNRMPKVLKEYVFRELWKLTFFIDTEDCKENRNINYKIIGILFNYNEEQLIKYITQESKYFSSKIRFSEDFSLTFIFAFLAKNVKIFHLLSEEVKKLIEEAGKKDYSLMITALFLFNDEDEYVKYFEDNCDYEILLENPMRNRFILDSIDSEYSDKIVRIFINHFISSSSFDMADNVFSNLIYPFVEYISKDNMNILLKGIESNGQVNSRGQAEEDHLKLKSRCTELNIDFDSYKSLF